MKYIDAEELKAEIKKRINELEHDKYLSVDSKTARIAELHFIDRSIDSLQQEQPEKDKKTFDDYLKASPSERRKMNMTEILGEEKLTKNKKQMEQQEVDLEKEEFVGVAKSPLKTFPTVNDFECGGSYRH